MNSSWNNSDNNVLWHNSNSQISLNNKNNKMVIAMVFIAFALVSVICAFCSSANKNNNEDNSTQIAREDLATDDQLVEGNSSNNDMASGDNLYGTNGEDIMQENIPQEIITGSGSTTEEIGTESGSTTDIEQPVAPIPTAVPMPTATPRPVITEYAYLVTKYTRKDSKGQIVYILANSETRYYSASELQGLTKQQLRFARNEIFARKGGRFTSLDLQLYFNSRSWYTPTRNAADFDDEDLNAYELANVKLFKSLE